MAQNTALYVAVYDNVNEALADLDAFEQLHSAEMIGKYDAAVIDKEDGKPHIVKRVDRPRFRVIPELLGSGALPRNELKEAAEELTATQVGLIVVGEPTLEKGFDQAVTSASKVVKREFDAATDQLTRELTQAFKD